jgi:hypothetical protein
LKQLFVHDFGLFILDSFFPHVLVSGINILSVLSIGFSDSLFQVEDVFVEFLVGLLKFGSDLGDFSDGFVDLLKLFPQSFDAGFVIFVYLKFPVQFVDLFIELIFS